MPLSSKTFFATLLAMLPFAFVWAYEISRFQAYENKLRMRLSAIAEKIMLPYKLNELSSEIPDAELLIPIEGLRLHDIADTWGDPRAGNRIHEGVDMFARRGTPVLSATYGYVIRTGTSPRGGNIVFILGNGGIRYYYAHLDSVADGIIFGKEVSTSTVIGFVGNTGNATDTPPHLHFGMYKNGPHNPYSLLVPRIY